MTEKKTMIPEISEDEMQREMRRYLRGYSVFRKLAEAEFVKDKHFGNPTKSKAISDISEGKKEIYSEARIRMFEIRRFVTSLPPGDEKVLLFLRYIHGESLESCAEKLELSARHIFRLQKSALLMAYRRFQKEQNQEEMNCIE